MSDDDNDDVLEKARARNRALAEQLATRPVKDVVGVIDASGRGGWELEDGRKVLHITLHAWRDPSGPVKTSPLSAEIATTQAAFDALWDRIHAYDVIRIRARVAEESVIGGARAEIVEFLGPDPDPELRQIAIDLQTPVIHCDPRFGDLTLNRSVNWYSTRTRWKGAGWRSADVELKAVADADGSPAAALDVARALWKDQKAWETRARDYAVQELLPIRNEDWIEEGEAPMTPRRFLRKMKLESITVHPDGAFDFWFNDGDIFYGHLIQVSGTLSEGPTLADIPG